MRGVFVVVSSLIHLHCKIKSTQFWSHTEGDSTALCHMKHLFPFQHICDLLVCLKYKVHLNGSSLPPAVQDPFLSSSVWPLTAHILLQYCFFLDYIICIRISFTLEVTADLTCSSTSLLPFLAPVPIHWYWKIIKIISFLSFLLRKKKQVWFLFGLGFFVCVFCCVFL